MLPQHSRPGPLGKFFSSRTEVKVGQPGSRQRAGRVIKIKQTPVSNPQNLTTYFLNTQLLSTYYIYLLYLASRTFQIQPNSWGKRTESLHSCICFKHQIQTTVKFFPHGSLDHEVTDKCRWPPNTENPLVHSFNAFFSENLITARHCSKPWRTVNKTKFLSHQ